MVTERERLVEAAYADYWELLERVQHISGTCGPHCDALVLHAPAAGCTVCNKYPDLQALRLANRIAFTGQARDADVPGQRPCPSQVLRSLDKIERWPGNIPLTPREVAARDAAWSRLLDEISQVTDVR